MQLAINIINQSPYPNPAYQTNGASGVDLQAFIAQSITLAPMQRCKIPTGIYLEIPTGYEAQVRPRSGLAINKGITCLNTPGTIDSDYRGEIQVILINLSTEPQTINAGDRIAQMVFAPVAFAHFTQTLTLQHTQRNNNGFGSTGTS
jgi:dUTP pyrophosphatase